MRSIELIQFSCEDHEKIDIIMKEMQKLRINDNIKDTLIFVEHPEIVTIGPKAKKENILPPEDYPRKFVDRGGGLTWHGPGQLVIYPIFKWDLKDEKNIKKIINKLEGWVINTFSDLGIDITPRVQQLKVEEPPKRKAGIKVANVAELVQKLKNEAKVI